MILSISPPLPPTQAGGFCWAAVGRPLCDEASSSWSSSHLTVSRAIFFSSSLTLDCLASSMSLPHSLRAASASACCLSYSVLLASAALSCISRSMPSKFGN